ncbi:MAG: hypothetical protein K2J11_03570 [Oscillospiraceae bacterium]|nr:hypothetical protein [Oscillospiraceae bacterium]
MILNLPTLIAIAVLYLFEFPLGALLCRYVSKKLSAVLNVALGILALILFGIVGDKIDNENVSRNGKILLMFISFYIYIPNLILYFKIRNTRKKLGAKKENYSFKKNVGMAAILTACHFPSVFIAFMMSLVVVLY